eukprot:TRINITY_DN499_c0_g1_i2.p1 TRINITY_DN499_c0_g1~~TRINITY_DN499_c0_g1_i2.p1  ORF type:complete len:123 (-),score=19.00 TRINITY_DN499_c0_g1_i2:105-473(-)
MSKKLGEERKNRDLKKTVRQSLRENPESHLSPALWSQINGNYLLPNFKKTESEFKASFCKGETSKPQSDKLYFRKADDLSKYGEAYFKDKIILSGRQAINTCLLYTSPSPRDLSTSRMPSSA